MNETMEIQKVYINGKTHPCEHCGRKIMTIFCDPECTEPLDDQDVCVSCHDIKVGEI